MKITIAASSKAGPRYRKIKITSCDDASVPLSIVLRTLPYDQDDVDKDDDNDDDNDGDNINYNGNDDDDNKSGSSQNIIDEITIPDLVVRCQFNDKL